MMKLRKTTSSMTMVSEKKKLLVAPTTRRSRPEREAVGCVVKSLRWPGAFTVAKTGKYSSIYVGDGTKRGSIAYEPTEPPEVQSDPLD
jgi:hypothetical protein